mgnify:FL=1
MEKKIVTNRTDSFAETCAAIISGVISVFLVFAVIAVPLIYDKSYFNILETKYKCFYMSVLVMLTVFLVLSIVMLVIDWKEFQGEHVKKLFASLKPANWKQTFRFADTAVLIFWLASAISTLQSEYLYESFWGNEGRYSGLFLMTLYVVMYFVVSRFWRGNKLVMQAFFAAGLIVCYVGITDYFQLDILHFRGKIKPEQSAIFTSTIGNINTYTAYVALVMGAAAAMFATAKGWLKTCWYYLCMVVSFFAIIMGCSDNAYLALGALFALLPLLVFRSRKGVVRYLVMAATFATVIQCIDFINQAYADMVIGLDSLFQILVNLPGLLAIVVLLWCLAAAVALYFRKQEKADVAALLAGKTQEQKEKSKVTLIRIWLGLILLGAIVLVIMLIDANALGHGSRYGSLGNYLVFNDNWGTKRGYIWRKSLELYAAFPFMHKLFGFGPDTFGIMTTQSFMKDMVGTTGLVFDTAHNEYLQFLLTIGPIGLAAYLCFLFGNGWKMAKYWLSQNIQIPKMTGAAGMSAESACVIGCLFAVVCYCAQALVNLNLPIATPVMWVLMSVGVASSRKK